MPLTNEGGAWVLSGRDGSTVLLDLLDPTPEPSGTFGYALETTDYDLDGRPDLHIGSFAGSYVFDGQDGSLFKTFGASACPAPDPDPEPDSDSDAWWRLGGRR